MQNQALDNLLEPDAFVMSWNADDVLYVISLIIINVIDNLKVWLIDSIVVWMFSIDASLRPSN